VTIFAIGTDIFVTGCASTYSLEQWFCNCGPWTTGGSLLSAGGFRRKIGAPTRVCAKTAFVGCIISFHNFLSFSLYISFFFFSFLFFQPMCRVRSEAPNLGPTLR
jgi:hypothetical protein